MASLEDFDEEQKLVTAELGNLGLTALSFVITEIAGLMYSSHNIYS